MRAPGAAVAVVLLAACGGGSTGVETVADWRAAHGRTVTAVGDALDRVQASTREGEPTGIRADCGGLRDSVEEARATPPVPDAEVDAALRKALDAVTAGVNECLLAMAAGDARQLERSIIQLRSARAELDTANAKLAR